ncbi:MAG TPA: FGGY-family carbohydrate kinase, partial [Propionibacteriaceae bacterium]|nr:FGGY-family carbohydrate kinase [Propionibacteriaceae bacterium]
HAARLLLMPDLISHYLTGRSVAEVTMASTTGLLDARTRRWSPETIDDLTRLYGLPLGRVLPDLVEPGTVLGPVDRSVVDSAAQVVAVGGHDTASAIVSVPATGGDFAYISSGTWSLVGLELDEPVLTADSSRANFTNELGVDDTVRYLKNVMGLWVLTESMRAWSDAGSDATLAGLLAEAAHLPPLVTVVDMADQRLIPPGDMPSRLAAMAAETGQPVPETPGEFTRCILDSLALAYRSAIADACRLAGRRVEVVHVVGGGSQNALLCRLTAEAVGLPVVAGPAEGTALGNLLVQARALGVLSGDLTELRRVAAESSSLLTYVPGGLGLPQTRWDEAHRRIHP